MGSSTIQGELWGKAPQGWAEIQEPLHRPLWEAMLAAAEAFRRDDGAILIQPNVFKYAVAIAPKL